VRHVSYTLQVADACRTIGDAPVKVQVTNKPALNISLRT